VLTIAAEDPGMSRLTGSILVGIIALAALGCVLMFNPFAMRAEPPPKKTPPTDFAADRKVAGGTPAPFVAKRAMGYLEDLCAIGPRISGTEGMKKQQELIKKHFEELGCKVEFQTFNAQQKSQKQPIEMANLIVSWNPDRDRRVILCSHYDTRPLADQEPNPRKWRDPFVSANDGGSGVALLMELGNHMKDLQTEVGVDFVFFDGEEYVFEKTDRYFFGSEHFANQYQTRKMRDRKYLAAVLLDMIGGKEARFPIEPTSWFQGAAVVKDIWGIAEEQQCKLFQNREGTEVQDDHVALGRAGIPAIDIIDFSYAHWHRLTDLPENCSGETLDQVAKVLSVWLQRVK
jgi:hypothetical protein